MDDLVDYLRTQLEASFAKKIKANSCPSCDLQYIETERGGVMCALCGHQPLQPEPTTEETDEN